MIATIQKPVSELAALYRGLGPVGRRVVCALAGIEMVLIAVAERDIQRRAADEIRGPKLLWRVVATQNLVGPAAYLGLGRRKTR